MDSNENSPVLNERAYWTHETAEKIGVGESTLRKWCIELEKNGYSFVKGEQEARAFLERDILVLMRLKGIVRSERKPIKEAAKIAVEEAAERTRTTPVHAIVPQEEQDRTTPVLVERAELSFTLDDIRAMVREELEADREERDKERVPERDEALMSVIQELTKEVARQGKQIEEQQQLLTNRDQQLMQYIRDQQETKRLAAATQQKKWWQFWN